MEIQDKVKEIVAPRQFYTPCASRLYSLHKIRDGKRRGVAFGMTEREARILSHVLKKEMDQSGTLGDDGKPLFEMSQFEIVPEN